MDRQHSFVIGINHRTSLVKTRDALGVSDVSLSKAFQAAFSKCCVKELVLLSTCNRVEWYGSTPDLEAAVSDLKSLWSELTGVPLPVIDEDAYVFTHEQAVEHLFRVSCSLDSLVIGEGQILGQVKSAYFKSAANKGAGLYLNHLFQKAISLGKRVRTETEINQGAVSISFAAVEICKKVFQNLSSKTALLVGAGEMSRLAATHLNDAGIGKLTFCNRTIENTAPLCNQFQAKAISLKDLPKQLPSYDIIISATGASLPIIKPEDIQHSVNKRKFKPQVLVDIAAPRDIDTGGVEFPSALVFSIDDLENVVDENRQKRTQASQHAELILQEELSDFKSWYLSLDVVPAIRNLRMHFQSTFDNELKKFSSKMSPDEFELVERFSHNVMNKVLHLPTSQLKQMGEDGMAGESIWMINKLFDLNRDDLNEEN